MIVVDTHVLVWWLTEFGKLTQRARKALRGTSADEPAIVSAVSAFEIATLVRRGRLQLAVPADVWLADTSALPEFRFEPVTVEIARLAGSLGDAMHGDPADRLIAATAIKFGASLVTADDKLRSWREVKTIW